MLCYVQHLTVHTAFLTIAFCQMSLIKIYLSIYLSIYRWWSCWIWLHGILFCVNSGRAWLV